jgi:hypothetical protein
VIEPIRLFLSHPFGLSVVALAVVVAGLLAAWLERRHPAYSATRLMLAAALPLPLLFAAATAVMLLVSPWGDPLINAVLLTVGLLGTFFSLMAGSLAALLVIAGLRR